jgi:hypothetical protein
MSRMHKPAVVPIELKDVDTWLRGSPEEAAALVTTAPVTQYAAGLVAQPTAPTSPKRRS